jgi:hypothetical protein
MEFFLHEYMLVIYGVVIWQVEQWFESKKKPLAFIRDHFGKNVISSLPWIGIVVAFDDELLARYNGWAVLDHASMPWYIYIAMGFSIDIVRSRIKKIV